MRHMFTTAAVMLTVMPAFIAGGILASCLGFHDGDEGKTMSIATALAFLAAMGAALAAPKGFARIPVGRQLVAALLGLAVALPAFFALLSMFMH